MRGPDVRGRKRRSDPARWFAVERLDIRDLINSSGSEQALGLAFHPEYTSNGRFFVYYTASNGDNTLARYQVSGDPDVADPTSAQVLFAQPDFAANHNGGMLAFGPDGYLYVGLGDGGGGGDPQANGQKRSTLPRAAAG
jgi:glucose/arabinose dehydrogenase